MGELHPNKAVWLKHTASTHFMAELVGDLQMLTVNLKTNKGEELISCSSFLFVASAWHQ